MYSVLAPDSHRGHRESPAPPDCFTDLCLDQVIDAVCANWEEYELKPLYYFWLHDLEVITYRQEVFRDLESPHVMEPIRSFARTMSSVRNRLAQTERIYYPYLNSRWLLDTAGVYYRGVRRLLHELTCADLRSRGLTAFRDFLASYVGSEAFSRLETEGELLQRAWSQVHYALIIKGLTVGVRQHADERDYSAEVEETFAKFREGPSEDRRFEFGPLPHTNHVQEQILERVARFYPDTFSALIRYAQEHAAFLDETIATFEREIHFYLAYLDFIAPLRRAGLRFCYPRVSTEEKEVYSREGFDLALAGALVPKNKVVCNDFSLTEGERILVVTGPNQGGKTTFARTFGQLHYLAGIGCPVPGREGQLFLADKIFTHFEREEQIEDLRSKLEDDLVRIHAALQQATGKSVLIMNEIFNSCPLEDARFLGREILEEIIALDAPCVFVTFIDEFASLHPKVVSMVGQVLPEDPSIRTFIFERRPADGLAYALSLARKQGLTYDQLKERIRDEKLAPVQGS